MASLKGVDKVVRLLLEDSRVEVDFRHHFGATPLFAACIKGHLRVVQTFLASGRPVDLSAKTKEGPWSDSDVNPKQVAALWKPRRWSS